MVYNKKIATFVKRISNFAADAVRHNGIFDNGMVRVYAVEGGLAIENSNHANKYVGESIRNLGINIFDIAFDRQPRNIEHDFARGRYIMTA